MYDYVTIILRIYWACLYSVIYRWASFYEYELQFTIHIGIAIGILKTRVNSEDDLILPWYDYSEKVSNYKSKIYASHAPIVSILIYRFDKNTGGILIHHHLQYECRIMSNLFNRITENNSGKSRNDVVLLFVVIQSWFSTLGEKLEIYNKSVQT